jgi:hypothetical protein
MKRPPPAARKTSPPLPRGFGAAARRVLAERPGTRRANEARWALERAALKILVRDGLAAVGRALGATGTSWVLAVREPGARSWKAPHPGGRHEIVVSVTRDRLLSTVLVSSLSTEERRIPPAQRARHARQEAFYARYMAAGRVAYASPQGERKLPRAERLLLRIGEFEADVNNGGFGQYLSNKGRRRAVLTLKALQAIGARRSARLLEEALRARTDAALEKLDNSFYRGYDDLAVLALDYVESGRR